MIVRWMAMGVVLALISGCGGGSGEPETAGGGEGTAPSQQSDSAQESTEEASGAAEAGAQEQGSQQADATDGGAGSAFGSIASQLTGGEGLDLGSAANEMLSQATFSKKDEMVASVEQKLSELDKQWSQWKERAGQLSGDAKQQWSRLTEQYQQHRDAAGEKLQALKGASQETWQQAADDFGNAMNQLAADYKKAAEMFTGEAGQS